MAVKIKLEREREREREREVYYSDIVFTEKQ